MTACITHIIKAILADEAKKIIDQASNKISSFITNTLGGDGLTEFSIDIPEDDVEIQYLNFKELGKENFSNTFSQLSLNTQEINDDTRYIINYGYGKRYLDDDKSLMTGINAFIDYDLEGHARTSFGVEAVSPGTPGKNNFEVHNVCRDMGFTHIEGLANLDKLIGKGRFKFIGLPLRIRGGTGSPIRAVAVFNNN